ncbi:MAG TPA: AraC family transcriptional regulator [Flavisolibacter sp.]|jgi:AraC-like DNA-binding protein
MICQRFYNPGSLVTPGWKNRTRVTFSDVSDVAMQGYAASTYSIKYTLRGTEEYWLDGRKYSVSTGRFLLVNRERPIDFRVPPGQKVQSFCIHLEHDLVQDMYAHMTGTDQSLLDYSSPQPSIPELQELIYSDGENVLGEYLRHMALRLDPKTAAIDLEQDEVYYNLTRRLLQLQNSIPKGGERLDVLRSSTRNELLRRLTIGRELIEAQKDELLDVNSIARGAMMSSSHFFRSFKKVYGLSPYQYHQKRRMERAASLLRTRKMNATEVAFECGFPDLPSFSKAFKKAFGQSPRQAVGW